MLVDLLVSPRFAFQYLLKLEFGAMTTKQEESSKLDESEESGKLADLSTLQRVELGSKVAAALLALTYVSGYLIATTYLGTYNIASDASEIFRAKYIYIGCQYWMFVTVFGVMARIGVLALHLGERNAAQTKDTVQIGDLEAALTKLRWGLVVGLILIIFSAEILFLTEKYISRVVPFQALFLLSIWLYQATFYAEYSKKSNGWGSIYGRKIIVWMRWMYGVVIPGSIAALRIARIAFPKLHWGWFRNHFLTLTVVYTVVMVIGAAIATLNWQSLRALQGGDPMDAGNRLLPQPNAVLRCLRFGKKYGLRLVFQLVVCGIAALFCLVAFVVLESDDSLRKAEVLYYGTLILALTVLSNILVLSLMYREMCIEQKKDPSIPWKNWLLTAVAAAVLYIVSVLSFSFLVYPFVPEQKAGGDYSSARPLTLSPAEAGSTCFSRDLNASLEGRKFYVIEEDTNWAYLAPEESGNPDPVRNAIAPNAWKWSVFCKEKFGKAGDKDGACRPAIIAINRSCLASMRDENVPPSQK
jgi:hypothetical protein